VAKESKRDRFIRVAESRTNKAIGMIRLIGNLSNKVNYQFTEADVKEIFTALEAELKDARAQFNKADAPAQATFKLGTRK